MPCVLIASGSEFSVDEFLEGIKLRPHNIVGKGEARPTASERTGEPYEFSSLSIIISEADLDGFEDQTIDAAEFLKRNVTELEALGRYPGVEEIRLDFSVRNQKVVTQHYRFPPNILSLAASLGASIEISQYAVERPAKIDYLKGDSE